MLWRLIQLNWLRALLIIILRVVDPAAHGECSHELRIERLQQFGDRIYIRHPRIKPEIVIISAEYDRHAVMDL